MADAGWYPDPGGSGQFRYWNGSAWSAELSPTPSTAPPGAPGTPGPGSAAPRRHRGAIGVIIGAVALVLVVGVVLLVVLRPWASGTEITDPPPTPTITGGDDGASPTPTPTPTPSSTPSRPATSSPQPSSGAPQGQVPCAEGDPRARADHPVDGRIHGGGLSVEAVPGWTTDGQISNFSFAYDMSSNEYRVTSNWIAISAVGALRIADGFETPQQAAQAVIDCASTASFYRSLTSVQQTSSAAVTVDGHRGWTIKARFLCDVEGHPEIAGDDFQVTVVDVGDGESLGMYVGIATIDDATSTAAIAAAAATLAVD